MDIVRMFNSNAEASVVTLKSFTHVSRICGATGVHTLRLAPAHLCVTQVCYVYSYSLASGFSYPPDGLVQPKSNQKLPSLFLIRH